MLPTIALDVTTKATETQVLQALTSLAGLPSRQADDAEMDRHMYFVALENVTRYALSEAVKAVLQNKLSHPFFPSPPELRRLCDEAQQPHIDMERRARLREETFAERRRMDQLHAAKTPESKARVAALHAAFTAQYQQAPEFIPTLDPDLVAKVPDAPSTFSKAKVA